ncbi:MAG: hypothetical protein IKH88_18390 [Prevotella sp.]|nr:hypothetical protein [Prevotella sp.]
MDLYDYFISKVLEEEGESNISSLPPNRTLYVDQFTDEPPLDDEPWKPNSMKDVFEHYQPAKSVELEDENGATVTEEFSFREIKDFEDEQLIAQSSLLSEEQAAIDTYATVARQMERNKAMRAALRDDAVRSSLRDALRALLAELENADNN